ncbi:MAG: Ig-like domain repeat protein [Terracidiphilus sp.]
MTGSLRSVRSIVATASTCCGRFNAAIATMLAVAALLSAGASAQNTTISGTVYDPRTTTSSLPLPNVLVYVTTGTVAPLTPGVQCLTASTPTGVTSYTNTAADGTFTLTDVPENAAYTLVIQAGKWRRQFSETVAAAPLTGLVLHMPADHTQGDIPLIAIATGGADGLECVFHDMGIADTEVTDDNGVVNPGGRIHLYLGSGAPGAQISPSTPSQTVLMGTATDSSLMNSYDMVMFPCQGEPNGQATPVAATNLLNYANAGGRVFTTHYSYAWLDPNTPYDSQFPPVADWYPGMAFPGPDPGVATINTGFTDGATLAQWLQNAGASYNNTPGQVLLSTLRHDFTDVIPPTQAWAAMNSDDAIMQITFNAPVGAPAANQCGRVLYNEYHVINVGGINHIYPSECPTAGTMSAQEEMLEYALFDLSSFVTPVVVPTLSVAFNPSPLIVKQNDTADQVTVDVTNTSSTQPIYSSAVLTIALPPGLTATALADSTGGWICTLSTLTCTRATSINASASDSVTLTVSVPAYPPGGLASYTGVLTVTISSPNFSSNVTASDTVIFQQPPTINWATPTPIVYGTALSAAQLDATSPLAGSFSYSPGAGTVLGVGPQTLTATFSPTDTTDYTTGTATVTLTVVPANPVVLLTASPNPAFISNPVTLTATIPSFGVAPTGTVTFYDGTTQLGSATVSAGSATLITSALTPGTHSITAVYSGDTSYTAATSAALAETLQDFTLALTGNSAVTGTATVPLGGVASYPLVITPVGGAFLPGAVSLTASGLPSGLTAVFTPATVAANSAATDLTLQVGPPGKAAVQTPHRPFRGGALPIALGLILLPFAGKMRKRAFRWYGLAALALAGAALAVGLAGCGVNLTPQTSTVTITAASGSLTHSITVSLTVE